MSPAQGEGSSSRAHSPYGAMRKVARVFLPAQAKARACAIYDTEYLQRMALTNLAVAEEALSLSPAERADLARLLIESLQDDDRTDDQIKVDLKQRLEALVSGKDSGLTFQEVFGRPL